jgi:hypothetical protein
MMRRRPLVKAMLALAALLVAVPASPQNPSDMAARNAARGLAETGKRRFEAGDYKGALEALNDAEKYFHAPTITKLRALTLEKMGQLVEARVVHQQIVDEKLASTAPPEFVAAKKDAKEAITALDARIPTIQIDLVNAPAGTRATLDGNPLEAADLGVVFQVNPGKHTITVEPPGAAKVTREVELKEKAAEKVRVDLAPAAEAGPTATASSSSAPAGGRSLLLPAIAFGAGGAGLLVGAITGGMAFSRAGDIRKLCGDDLVCPESSRDKVDLEGAKGFGYASTVGFVVAGIGVAAGVALLLLPIGKKKEEPARAAVVVGPGFLGVKGTFQ